MNSSHTAFGSWSAGRFMHFGEPVNEERFDGLVKLSFEQGTRHFLTADVYGSGRADELLGRCLKDLPRQEYGLTGMIGHDIYEGIRQGSKGYPRFTDPSLRGPDGYTDYLVKATEKMLERCGVDSMDCVLLHNPDQIGYTSDAVWKGLSALKDRGLTKELGIAPGPANGFTLDMVLCMERFKGLVDWAMIILSPLEPWPGRWPLKPAAASGVKIVTRVTDHGGLFWGDVPPGHVFRDGDHRTFRPQGWVEHGNEKIDRLRHFAEARDWTVMQLAAQWCLSQSPVECVAPTLIQETGPNARPIEEKVIELAATPAGRQLGAEEIEEIAAIGNNEGCMMLKGASNRHVGQEPRPDEWPMGEAQLAVAERWQLGTDW